MGAKILEAHQIAHLCREGGITVAESRGVVLFKVTVNQLREQWIQLGRKMKELQFELARLLYRQVSDLVKYLMLPVARILRLQERQRRSVEKLKVLLNHLASLYSMGKVNLEAVISARIFSADREPYGITLLVSVNDVFISAELT
jgi:hypothetical protein